MSPDSTAHKGPAGQGSQQTRLHALLTATARRDEKAFALLYQHTSANLFGVALRILKQEKAAEDALQDAFVNIWHNAGEFHAGKGSPMAWMASIVRYRALDIIRRNKPTVSIEDENIDNALDNEASPLASLMQSSMAKALMA